MRATLAMDHDLVQVDLEFTAVEEKTLGKESGQRPERARKRLQINVPGRDDAPVENCSSTPRAETLGIHASPA